MDDSIADIQQLGGKVLSSMKLYGRDSRFFIVQDPAGAVCALLEDKRSQRLVNSTVPINKGRSILANSSAVDTLAANF